MEEEDRGSEVVALIRQEQVHTATLAADVPSHLFGPVFQILPAEVVRDYGLVVDGATRVLGLEVFVDGHAGFARAKRLICDVYNVAPSWGKLLDGVATELGQRRMTLGIWGKAGALDPAISVRFDGVWPKLPVFELLKRCRVPVAGVLACEAHTQQLFLSDVERFSYRVDSPESEPWFEVVFRNRPPAEDGDSMAARLVTEAASCGAGSRQQAWLGGLLKALRPTDPLDWPVGFRFDMDAGLRPGMSVGSRGLAATTAIALIQPFAPRDRIGHVLGAMMGATGAADRFEEVTLRTRDTEPPEILLRVRGVDR